MPELNSAAPKTATATYTAARCIPASQKNAVDRDADQQREHRAAAQRRDVAARFLEPPRSDGIGEIVGLAHREQHLAIDVVRAPAHDGPRQRQESARQHAAEIAANTSAERRKRRSAGVGTRRVAGNVLIHAHELAWSAAQCSRAVALSTPCRGHGTPDDMRRAFD